jgi:hypothetical protein
MENGPQGGSRALPQAPPQSGPTRVRRLTRLKDWFFRKPKPVPVIHPQPPEVRHQPDPPAIVLSCERCGFDYSITRIEISGRPGVVWTCECGSEFIPPGGPESFDLVRP